MKIYNSRFEIIALVKELEDLKNKTFMLAYDSNRSDIDRARAEGFVSAYDFVLMRLTKIPHEAHNNWECDSDKSPNGLCSNDVDFCKYCGAPMDERK